MIRIIAWVLLLLFLPLLLLAFIATHFVALLWLALVLGVAVAIYGVLTSRPTSTKSGPPGYRPTQSSIQGSVWCATEIPLTLISVLFETYGLGLNRTGRFEY